MAYCTDTITGGGSSGTCEMVSFDQVRTSQRSLPAGFHFTDSLNFRGSSSYDRFMNIYDEQQPQGQCCFHLVKYFWVKWVVSLDGRSSVSSEQTAVVEPQPRMYCDFFFFFHEPFSPWQRNRTVIKLVDLLNK